MRKSTCPVLELNHPNKSESPVKKITHSNCSFGAIISGYNNGDIVSFSSSSSPSDMNSWVSGINNYFI